ncbi:hypothetical protein N9Q22_00135 [bacterium]|nr:hypothetical protein [bacterium]MDB4189807.1 hypothetical protein [bacterium]MDB4226003.1 hypothetical protein [Flavobacteriaceae bacterium]MDB9956034.1 hypothetical protein [Flavobacteriaceae bacterium]
MPYLDKKEFANYLLGWDEKHTDYLKHIYSENINKQNFIKLVTDLFLEDKGLELSTSWLIKYHFDMKETLKNEDIKSVLLNLKNLTHWGSELHILQIIPKIKLSKDLAELLEFEIHNKLKSENKFVRAAAYEAYSEIVELIPELENEFRTVCFDALKRESASVKVKIKRVLNRI